MADSLTRLAPSSRARTLVAIKSLLAFGQRTGYLPLNVGTGAKLPASKNMLAERITTEPHVIRMLALEPDRRNQMLLRLLYMPPCASRRSAVLAWCDLQPRTDGGRGTVFGERSKTRGVLLPSAIWRELLRFRQGAGLDTPVFPSGRGGGHLHPTAAERIVRKPAQRAGLELAVYPLAAAQPRDARA